MNNLGTLEGFQTVLQGASSRQAPDLLSEATQALGKRQRHNSGAHKKMRSKDYDYATYYEVLFRVYDIHGIYFVEIPERDYSDYSDYNKRGHWAHKYISTQPSVALATT